MGAASLYKVPAAGIALAWLVLWLVALPRRDALVRTGWFAAGMVAPWLVAALWFAAHGALGVFVDSVFFYQRHWIAMIDPPWRDVADQFVSTAAVALAPLWLAAAAGIALTWRRDRARAACLVAWIASATIAIVLQRQLSGYHFLLLVPALAVAAALGIVELAARPRWRVALAAIAVLVGLAARDWVRAYGGHDFTRGQFVPAAQEDVARYIAAHSRPSDGILVWALAPGIYALSDRHPTTRFPFHRLLYTDSPLALAVPGRDARRAELMTRLRADPPAFVVVGLHDTNPFEPQDSVASLVAFRELDQLVQRDYREVMRNDHYVVLARSAPPAR